MKIKKYLVTGGSGFIGSNICKNLLDLNYQVIVYDDYSRNNKNNFKGIKQKIKFIKGDVRNRKKLFLAVKKVDAVIHLAYINGTKYFYSKPDLVLDIAVKGIINIIDACKKFKVKEFYLASSSEVYQTPIRIPTDENEILKIPDVHNPRYSYGGGKIISELIAINYGKKFFNKMVIFRPHNVYGPNMGNEHVIPEILNKFKKIKNGQIKIQGSGKEIRSFIHIDDFTKAFGLLIKKGKHLNIYNIGTTEKITISNLVKLVSRIKKIKINIIKSPLTKGSTKIRLPDIKKIKKLGFKQSISLKKGIEKLLS